MTLLYNSACLKMTIQTLGNRHSKLGSEGLTETQRFFLALSSINF